MQHLEEDRELRSRALFPQTMREASKSHGVRSEGAARSGMAKLTYVANVSLDGYIEEVELAFSRAVSPKRLGNSIGLMRCGQQFT